jgi:DNA repair photolyase
VFVRLTDILRATQKAFETFLGPAKGKSIPFPSKLCQNKLNRSRVAMSFIGWQKVNINVSNGTVESIAPVIISASRATDIPAFYADWFMHRLRTGYVKWFNRFNGQSRYVCFEKTRAIVFWTKNAEPMMKYLPELDRRGTNYYFTFTLNDYEKENLESKVLPLQQRINTFKRLSDTRGKGKVVWRYDPLILTSTITVDTLLDKIYGIGKQIHQHTEKMVISFIDINLYKKVRQNLVAAGFKDCKEFTTEDMAGIAKGLQEINREWNIEIATCAEATDLSAYGINHNKCIDDKLMIRQFSHDKELMDFLGHVPPEEGLIPFIRAKGKRTKVLKDLGQRKDCGCIPSKDIGQYDTFINGCIYCYANTSPRVAQMNYQKHRYQREYAESILSD